MKPAAFKRFKRKIIKFLFKEQWSVLLCSRENAILAHIKPSDNNNWADPFPVMYNGRFYLFVEQQLTGKKGTLGYILINDDLSYSDFTPILEKDYHLSWPFIFSHNGEWYMIPETHERRGIDLYKAEHFPDKWSFCLNLIDNITAVDTALIFYDKRWWLFTGIGEQNNGDSLNSGLSVFWSDVFPSSSWNPLPDNPVIRGLSNSRMAGRIFIDDSDGGLTRPAQNCLKEYGREVVLNRINALTPSKYEERSFAVLKPEREIRAACTHTYNICGPYLVRDIKTRKFSLYPFRKRRV